MAAQKDEGYLKYADLTLGEQIGFSNARGRIDPAGIRELADSIENVGLLNRLIVWPVKRGKETHHVIIAGARRYRAIGLLLKAKRANGLRDKVPVRFLRTDDTKRARAVAIIDNLQREDLTSYEVAKEIAALLALGMSQKEVAEQLSKSAAYVSRAHAAYKNSTSELREAWKQGLPADDVQSFAKLPAPEQATAVKEAMGLRVANGEPAKAPRAAKAKARKIAKEAKAKTAKSAPDPKEPRKVSPSRDHIRQLHDICKQGSKPSQYVLGMLHALEFVLGDRGVGEFDKPYNTHANKLAKAGKHNVTVTE